METKGVPPPTSFLPSRALDPTSGAMVSSPWESTEVLLSGAVGRPKCIAEDRVSPPPREEGERRPIVVHGESGSEAKSTVRERKDGDWLILDMDDYLLTTQGELLSAGRGAFEAGHGIKEFCVDLVLHQIGNG